MIKNMCLNRFICIGFIIISYYGKAQQISFSNDSLLLKETCLESDPDNFSSIIFLNQDSMLVERMVFNSIKDSILLYRSFYSRDTLICIDYWSNGKKKKIQKYSVDSTKQIIIEKISWEKYCNNGQIINKALINTTNPQHLVTYYCNGNKASEMYWSIKFRYGVTGKLVWWYEDGQVQFEKHFDDKGYKMGEWKYWKKDGTLDRIEIYKDDELIETIKGTVLKKLNDKKQKNKE